MSELLDQFECVRLVRMNGLDLNLFQFDYDQTWAALFFRHDGTLLARYGTRADRDGMKFNSVEGFVSTMRHVLQVDQSWQESDAALYAEKRGPDQPHSTVDEIPSETIQNILARQQQGKQSCIHCHNVYDARRDYAISQGVYDPAKRFKYPMPNNIGLEMDANSGTRINHVIPDSLAASAGIQPGQVVEVLNGQRIHSLADIQFVLHNLGEDGELKFELASEDGSHRKAQVALTPGWRISDIGWRASMYGMPPKPGLWVQAATDEEKANRGIAADRLALKVRGVFGDEVRKHGLKKDDWIVRFGDQTRHHTEGQFHSHLRLNYYRPDAQLPLELIRDGKRVELTVTFANRNE